MKDYEKKVFTILNSNLLQYPCKIPPSQHKTQFVSSYTKKKVCFVDHFPSKYGNNICTLFVFNFSIIIIVLFLHMYKCLYEFEVRKQFKYKSVFENKYFILISKIIECLTGVSNSNQPERLRSNTYQYPFKLFVLNGCLT